MPNAAAVICHMTKLAQFDRRQAICIHTLCTFNLTNNWFSVRFSNDILCFVQIEWNSGAIFDRNLLLLVKLTMEKAGTCTDTFGFGEQALFEQIRQTLPNDCSRTLNIVECKEDVVFAWNSSDCCMLTLNWRAARSKNDGSIKYQVCGTFCRMRRESGVGRLTVL